MLFHESENLAVANPAVHLRAQLLSILNVLGVHVLLPESRSVPILAPLSLEHADDSVGRWHNSGNAKEGVDDQQGFTQLGKDPSGVFWRRGGCQTVEDAADDVCSAYGYADGDLE